MITNSLIKLFSKKKSCIFVPPNIQIIDTGLIKLIISLKLDPDGLKKNMIFIN